ncbi:MAG: GAF domain-containing protein, partial [Microbacteriaceae bacterium]|nr:GAF domain-containing protein [Microbacteriaceae bacterium]
MLSSSDNGAADRAAPTAFALSSLTLLADDGSQSPQLWDDEEELLGIASDAFDFQLVSSLSASTMLPTTKNSEALPPPQPAKQSDRQPHDASQEAAAQPLQLAEMLPNLRLLVDLATKNLQGQRGTLLLYDHKTDELCSLVTVGKQEVVIRFDASRGIAGAVFQTGAPLNISDAYQDTRFLPDVDRRLNFRSKQILCVPVFVNMPNKKVTGCLQIINHVDDVDFTAQNLE